MRSLKRCVSRSAPASEPGPGAHARCR
jgi:hypothetical protein